MRSSPGKRLTDVQNIRGGKTRRLADEVGVRPSGRSVHYPYTIAASEIKDIRWRGREFMKGDALAECGEEYVGGGVAGNVSVKSDPSL
jgi:hypothetical protein